MKQLERVLIFGATSAMAEGAARAFARQGAALALAARNVSGLESLAQELRELGARAVHTAAMEATDRASMERAFDRLVGALGGFDGVLIAHGYLPDQQATEQDPEAMLDAIEVNGTSVLWIAHRAALELERQGHGCLAVIGSGAGVRGRRNTHTYGAAKALVQVYFEGLRARLHRRGVQVLTVLPCFVDTPMTAYLPKRLRFVNADDAGRRIQRAMQRGRDRLHIPGWWRLALFLARNAPEALVKRSRSEERFAARLAAEAREPDE